MTKHQKILKRSSHDLNFLNSDSGCKFHPTACRYLYTFFYGSRIVTKKYGYIPINHRASCTSIQSEANYGIAL